MKEGYFFQTSKKEKKMSRHFLFLLERGKNEIVQTEIEGDVVCWCYRA
jgi:hypothetical protein